MAQTLTSALAETHHVLALAGDIEANEIAQCPRGCSIPFSSLLPRLGNIGTVET
jgi:hypothetical protein